MKYVFFFVVLFMFSCQEMENKHIKFSAKEIVLGDNIDIHIEGLNPNEKYSIYLQSIYDAESFYYSTADFIANKNGKISIDTSESVGGDFLGIDSLGLFSSIGYDENAPSFLDLNDIVLSEQKLQNFVYLVLNDSIISKESFYFIYQSDKVKKIEIREKGIKADLYLANKTKNLIVVLGGSEGDVYTSSFIAKILSSKGFNTCAISYFGANSQQKKMTKIPLETIDTSLNFVKKEIGEIENLYLYGISKGAELALIYASLHSKVKGVIGVSSSSVVMQSGNLSKNSTRSFKEKELDYMPFSFDGPSKFDEYDKKIYEHYYYPFLEAAKDSVIIKVENIQGDIVLFSGKDDKLWPSAYMSDMISDRISEHNFKYSFKNYQYEKVGHFISIPYLPSFNKDNYRYAIGGNDKENACAHLDSWNKILAYLESKSIKN